MEGGFPFFCCNFGYLHALKLNSSNEIGTVLADPVGFGVSTTSIDPNCTVSEKLNIRFPAVETPAATLKGLYVESAGGIWFITANS